MKLDYKIKPIVDSTTKHFNGVKLLRLRNDNVNTVIDFTTDIVHKDDKKTTPNVVSYIPVADITSVTSKMYISEMKNDDLNSKFFEEKPIQVKKDKKVVSFLEHTLKQSLKIFINIKKKINDYKINKEIDYLARNFKIKYGAFVDTTKKQSIKTKDGMQKVVINTLQTLNSTLHRLMNILKYKLIKKGITNNENVSAIFGNEIDKLMTVENKHASAKFGICQSNDSFIKFTVNIIDILLKFDDNKLKICFIAITDTLKQIDFGVNSKHNNVTIRKGIEYIEGLELDRFRNHLSILKNNLMSINKPLVLREANLELSTVIFLGMIKKLNDIMPNDEYEKFWCETINKLSSFGDGNGDGGDISVLMQNLLRHFRTAFEKLNESDNQIYASHSN